MKSGRATYAGTITGHGVRPEFWIRESEPGRRFKVPACATVKVTLDGTNRSVEMPIGKHLRKASLAIGRKIQFDARDRNGQLVYPTNVVNI